MTMTPTATIDRRRTTKAARLLFLPGGLWHGGSRVSAGCRLTGATTGAVPRL